MLIDYQNIQIVDPSYQHLYAIDGNSLIVNSGYLSPMFANPLTVYSAQGYLDLSSDMLRSNIDYRITFEFKVERDGGIPANSRDTILIGGNGWWLNYQPACETAVLLSDTHHVLSPLHNRQDRFYVYTRYYDNNGFDSIANQWVDTNLAFGDTYYIDINLRRDSNYAVTIDIYDNIARNGTPIVSLSPYWFHPRTDTYEMTLLSQGGYPDDYSPHKLTLSNLSILRPSQTGDLSCFIEGCDHWDTTPKTANCFIAGPGLYGEDAPLYTVGYIQRSGIRDMFTQGALYQISGVSLSICNSGIGDSLPLYTIGDIQQSDILDLYTVGGLYSNSGIPLSICNYAINTDCVNLSISGGFAGDAVVGMSQFPIQVLGDTNYGSLPRPEYVGLSQFPIQVFGDTNYGSISGSEYVGMSQFPIQVFGDTWVEYTRVTQLPIQVFGDVGVGDDYQEYTRVTQLPIQVFGDVGTGDDYQEYTRVTQLPLQVFYDVSRPAQTGTTLYTKAYDYIDCYTTLFTKGCLGDLNNSATMFIWGDEGPTSRNPCYIYGYDISNSGVDMYVCGAYGVDHDTSLYECGYDALDKSNTLYMCGSYISDSGLDMYMYGWDILTKNTTLYTCGYDITNSGLSEFIHGSIGVSDNLSLYTKGMQLGTSNLALYIGSDPDSISRGITCCIINEGLIGVAPLYIGGYGVNPGALTTDSTLYLYMGKDTDVEKSATLFCSSLLGGVNTFADSYICGAFGATSGVNLVIPNVVRTNTKTTKFFISGF